MKKFKQILIAVFTFTPLFSFAKTFAELTVNWVNFINKIVAVLGSFAFLVFMWGGAMVILGSGDSSKVAEGRKRLWWGLVGLFVMFTVWGLVKFLDSTIFGGTSAGTGVGGRGIGPL